MIRFDNLLANLRGAGLTHRQIARAVGVSTSAVTQWAAGVKAPTHYRTVLPLLDLHFDRCADRHRPDLIGAP